MDAAAPDTLRRTALYDAHVAAGAKLVPFAGWEMPVQYQGIREEHLAVRSGVGIFDVSHMGEVETSGPDAEAFLQHVLSNDVTKVPVGGAQYSVLCREDGGVLEVGRGHGVTLPSPPATLPPSTPLPAAADSAARARAQEQAQRGQLQDA